MNLTNLFNFRYLYQNIKKSKSIIILLICAIPFINLWVVGLDSLTFNYVLDFSSISGITSILAFIFPPLLAYLLFSFLFKRKTVDLIMSLPITRKKIYASNVLGGIIIILIVLLITTIGFFLLSLLTKVYIPLEVLFDYFIYWSISYIFVFLIAVLAISFAGNAMSSLVIILLLLFFIPTITYIDYITKHDNHETFYSCVDTACFPDVNWACTTSNNNCKVIDENRTDYYFDNIYTVTLSSPVNYVVQEEYDTFSLIKTSILSIIYLVLGYYAFKYRKMEDSENSFKNKYLYELLKIATFIPVTFIAFVMSIGNANYLLIGIAICISYYFVYDLVLRRTLIKPLKVFFKALIATGILFGVYTLITYIYDNNVLYIDSLDEVKVSYLDTDLSIVQEFAVNDSDLIKKLIKEERNPGANYSIDLYINNKYHTIRSLSSDTYNELKNYAKENNLDEQFTKDNIIYVASTLDPSISIPLSNKFKELLVNYIDTYEDSDETINFFISIYKYENHELKDIKIKINSNLEIINYIKKYYNEDFLDNFDGDNIAIAGEEGISYEEQQYIFSQNKDRLYEFLNEHKNDEIEGDFVVLYNNNTRYIINHDDFYAEYSSYTS